MGIFDAIQQSGGSLDVHDVSIHSSIQNVRHALALNENRTNMEPVRFSVEAQSTPSQGETSIVEAWFFGINRDMGKRMQLSRQAS